MKILFVTLLSVFSFICIGQVNEPAKKKPVKIVLEEPTKSDSLPINGVYPFPDVYAEYKGGAREMMKFIQKNIEYPQKSIENEDQGKVYMKFVVDKKGKIKDVIVERGVTTELDREAKRMVEMMPKWKPAKVDGKKVGSIVRLPIVFTLN